VRYTLDARAEKVTVTVRNADDAVVRVVDLGGQTAGTQTFQFDGRDDQGRVLPDGSYRIEVAAQTTGDEAPKAVATVSEGIVDGVDLSVDPPVLLVGWTRLPLTAVREVHDVDATNTGS
jgi:flagellar basal-body rod modification protein FlgD